VIWLCDGSAINRIARESKNYNVVFERLTKLVAEAKLTFCDGTLAELERTAEGDPAALWVSTVKDQRADSVASYSTLRWVGANCKDVVDEDDRYDCAAEVLAHAKSLRDGGAGNLQVVTEDIANKPTRIALAAACASLGIASIRVDGMMAACGITWP
jgi:hypothetical protein